MGFSSQTRFMGVVLAFVIVIASASRMVAQDPFAYEPIPNGPNAKTNGFYREGLFRYFSQIVTHYESNTKDSDHVKAVGIELLTEVVRLRCLVRLNDIDIEHLNQLGNAAIEAGSNDPLVRQRHGRLRAIYQDFEVAREVLLECDAAVADSDYPAIVPMLNSLYLCSLARAAADEELMQTHFPKFLERFVHWLQQESQVPGNRRYVFDLAYSVASDFSGLPAKLAIVQALQERGGIDPWIDDVLTGVIEMDIAWELRTGAFAGEVTAGGWQGFSDHLQISSERLQRAWESQPDDPEAASFMISVAMAGQADDSPRVWFDRAVEAEMDHPNAYGRFATSLQPRWGGSHQSMQRFGLECLATKRFDTLVPLMLFHEVLDIEMESGQSHKYWRNETVYGALREMFEGYRQAPATAELQDMYVPRKKILSRYAAVALLGEHWKDARAAIDSVGELDASVMQELQVGTFEVSHALAVTGNAKGLVLAAEQLAGENTEAALDQAIEKFDAASQQNDDERATVYLSASARMLREQRDFQRGESIPLTFDEHLSGWRRTSGEWFRESDTAVIGSRAAVPGVQHYLPFMLNREHKFRPPYLFSAEIEELEGHPRGGVGVTIGDVAFGGVRVGNGRFCVTQMNAAGVELGNADPNTGQYQQPAGSGWPKRKYRMEIRVWPNSLLLFINGEGPFAKVAETDFRSDMRFGVAGRCLGVNSRIRFSNIRIQKLPYDPVAELSKHEEIVAATNKMIEFDPDDWYARWIRGASHFELANYDAALADFIALERLRPNLAAANYGAGLIYAKMHRYPEAIGKFKLAEQENPTDHRVLREWAELEMSAEDTQYLNLESALAHALQAEQMNFDPETVWQYRLTVAEIHAKLGDHTKAFNKVSSIEYVTDPGASEQIAAKKAEFRERKRNSFKSAVASLFWEGDMTTRIWGIVLAVVLSAVNLIVVSKAAKSGRLAGVAAGVFAGAISLGVPAVLAIVFGIGEGPAFIELLAGVVAMAAIVGAIGGFGMARNKSSDSSTSPPITTELLDSV